MYKLTKKTPANWGSEARGRPLVVLEETNGGQSVIAKDDGCFVLYNGSESAGREFRMVYHWYPEAAQALARLLVEVPAGQALVFDK